MKIDNNQAYNNYSNLNNTNQSSDTKSFSSYLEESKEESKNNLEEKSSSMNIDNSIKKKPSFLLDFLDKHNLFEEASISKEDEMLFRYIIDDDIIRANEMKMLSYEQMKTLKELVEYKNLSKYSNPTFEVINGKLNVENFPPQLFFELGTNIMDFSKTDNEDFNRALFETANNIEDNMDRHRFFFTMNITMINNQELDLETLIATLILKYKKLAQSKAFSSEEQRQMVQNLLDNFIKLNETFNRNKMN